MVTENTPTYPDPNRPIFAIDIDGAIVRFFTIATEVAELPWIALEDLIALCEIPVEIRSELTRQSVEKYPAFIRMTGLNVRLASQVIADELITYAVHADLIESETAETYHMALVDAVVRQANATRPHSPYAAIEEAFHGTWRGHVH